jgi:choline-glycine betaine transporter
MGEELTVEVIKQLPLAVVAIVACIALWRKLSAATEAHIKDLRDDKKEDINDLRARVMAVEDHLHISRSDRMKYIPSLTMPAGKEMKDLD